MTLLWLFVQLVFWCFACIAITSLALAAIVAPPYFAGRAIIRHRRKAQA